MLFASFVDVVIFSSCEREERDELDEEVLRDDDDDDDGAVVAEAEAAVGSKSPIDQTRFCFFCFLKQTKISLAFACYFSLISEHQVRLSASDLLIRTLEPLKNLMNAKLCHRQRQQHKY